MSVSVVVENECFQKWRQTLFKTIAIIMIVDTIPNA